MRSSTLHLLSAGIVVLFGIFACSPEADSPDRIVLVTIDTLRADHVGCYGAKGAKTPQLDALAASGVRFEVAVSPAPLTLPAHASLMTALSPPSHGVRHNSLHRLAGSIPTLAESLRQAGYTTAAFVGAVVLHRRFGLSRGFDRYDDGVGGRRSGTVGFAERTADVVADAVLAWLEKAPARFFLWIHFYDPHRTYDPPPGFASAIADPYAGEIAFVDSQLGRILDAIRDRWGEQGLLLAATSDHGESRGEHGEPSHSYLIYEATQRIPMILSGFGLPAGRTVRDLVRLIDLGPTILDLAGAEPLRGAQGRSLLPLIAGRDSEPRIAYMEALAPQFDFHWSPLLGVRSQRFKYIRAPKPELYDLRIDARERRNVAEQHPDLVARLDGLLEEWLAPGPAEVSTLRLSPEERAQLRSLGYVVPETTPNRPLGEVGGPNPADEISLLRELGDAEQLLAGGEASEALVILKGLGRHGPLVAALRAAAAVTAGDLVEAERSAREVLAAEPGRLDVLVILGRALVLQGRDEEARRPLEAVLAIDPKAKEAAHWLSRIESK